MSNIYYYQCKFCEEVIPQTDLENHCKVCSVSCPNECSDNIKISELDEHKKKSSLYSIYCTDKESGCNWSGSRSELKIHQSLCIYVLNKKLELEFDQVKNEYKQSQLKINQLMKALKTKSNKTEFYCTLSDVTKITKSFIEEHKEAFYEGEWLFFNGISEKSGIFDNF